MCLKGRRLCRSEKSAEVYRDFPHRQVTVRVAWFSLKTVSWLLTQIELTETRNRLHIYSRVCCTWCGPRYEPLSRALFVERGID